MTRRNQIILALAIWAVVAGALVYGAIRVGENIAAGQIRADERATSAQQIAQAIQSSRVASSVDTCQTLKTVIREALKPGPAHYKLTAVTPNGRQLTLIVNLPKRPDAAQQEIKADHLANCAAHARSEVALSPHHSH